MTSTWLSKTAVLWAMDETPPGLPPQLKWTLTALARYASEDGTAAFPAKQTLAYVTGKSARQVQRDLGELISRGLIRHGDQRLAKDIRADQRPTVYDLTMPRGDTHDSPHGGTPTTPRKRRGETSGRSTGRHPSAQRGDTHDSRRVLKTPEQGASSRGSAGAAPRSAPAKSKAGQEKCPWCAGALVELEFENELGEADHAMVCEQCEHHPDDCECSPPKPVKERCAFCRSDDHEHCMSYRNGQGRCFCDHSHEDMITVCYNCLLGKHAQCSRDNGVTCHCPCGGPDRPQRTETDP